MSKQIFTTPVGRLVRGSLYKPNTPGGTASQVAGGW